MKPLPEVYDELYLKGYHNDPTRSHAMNLCYWLETNLDGFDSILDIGCSSGWVLRRYNEEKIAVGVDVSSVAVQICKEAGLTAHNSPAHELPFVSRSFDVVISTDCFEHIEQENALEAIQEAVRISRKVIAMKICCRADKAKWKDIVGQPLHLTVQPLSWWLAHFDAFVRAEYLARGESPMHKIDEIDEETFVIVKE
jgi:cyclopropane fatty-acyl-phospholipid synthase-like methyltransferase